MNVVKFLVWIVEGFFANKGVGFFQSYQNHQLLREHFPIRSNYNILHDIPHPIPYAS